MDDNEFICMNCQFSDVPQLKIHLNEAFPHPAKIVHSRSLHRDPYRGKKLVTG